MARFSFIIPVYGTERYLARCLDSLVAQTDQDFDVIVVDDGSPKPAGGGDCAEIVARYGARCRCICHPCNRGLFLARATAMLASEAEYVIPLDSDDSVGPELVARVRQAADVDDADVIVYHMSKVLNGRPHPVKYNRRAGRCSGYEALEQFFEGRIFNPVCGKVIRRSVMRRAFEGLGVGEDFYLNSTEDLCWLVPILIQSKRVSFIEYDGYSYWQGDNSLSRATPATEWFQRLAAQCQLSVYTAAAYAEREGLPPRVVAEIRRQILVVVRWLLRTYPRLPAGLFPEEVLDEARRENAKPRLLKLVPHLRKYGLRATIREILGKD